MLSLLFALPGALAAVISLASHFAPPAASLEFAFACFLIPHALVPLAALLYATGIIQDEVEEQTLTYLLMRPVPRWLLYFVRLLATVLVTSVLAAAFTAATLAVIAVTVREPFAEGLVLREMTMAALVSLALVGYCGLFGLLGLLVRRSLLIGVGYIVLFEGFLASLDTVARRLTIMYYFRVLVLRWLDPAEGKDWLIDLATAPAATTCVLTLLGVGFVFGTAAAILFTTREFRMKTPEGS